jgi:NADPH:quinone reductase-like Zn-dependent oxidoreductase
MAGDERYPGPVRLPPVEGPLASRLPGAWREREVPDMKAIRVHRFGPPDVLQLEDVPRPEPGGGEVVVRVAAAGVGPWDALVRSGRSDLRQPLPLTPGSDLAGAVAAVGPGTPGLREGDVVFGSTNARFTGAYADYAVALAGKVARKPANVGDAEAAGAPVVTVTAWQMLFEQGRLSAGQRVLIHGAAGSVGEAAVQLARAAGAEVVGTVTGRGVDYAKSLGAHEVIDNDAEAFEHRVAPVDLVIDTVGGDVLARSLAVVKPGGALVSIVSKPDEGKAAERRVRATYLIVDVTTRALETVAEKIAAGQLKTRIGVVLSLGEARAAHEMLAGTRPRPPGKIVLRTGA